MYNEKTKEGLIKIRDGIDMIINAMNEKGENAPVTATATGDRKVETPTAPKRENAVAPKKTTASFDKEDLDSMAYNDLKKLAKDLGVSGAGARDAIIDRILGVNLNATEDGEVEVEEEPTEAPKPKKNSGVKKLGKKTVDDEPDEEEPEDATDPVYEQVLEVTEDMSVEELGEILSDIGISPKGKRQALIDKIYKAVKDGDLSLDDDGDDADSEEPDEDEEETADVEDTEEAEDTADEDDEDDGVNNPDNMTEARKEACEQYADEITNDFKNGDLNIKDIKEFCIEFYGEEAAEDIEELDEESLLETYIDGAMRMIDDDGELIEEGAYLVNGEYFCCGRPLQYTEETDKYICEMCGEEYDAE